MNEYNIGFFFQYVKVIFINTSMKDLDRKW